MTYLVVTLAQINVYVVSNNTAGVEGTVTRRLQLLSSPQLHRPGNISSFVMHCGTYIWLFIRLSVSVSLRTHKEHKKKINEHQDMLYFFSIKLQNTTKFFLGSWLGVSLPTLNSLFKQSSFSLTFFTFPRACYLSFAKMYQYFFL